MNGVYLFNTSLFSEYEVVVVTGNMKGGGTDANVHVTLFGKTGQTPKLHLKANHKNVFERGRSDTFTIATSCVGPLTKLRYVKLISSV